MTQQPIRTRKTSRLVRIIDRLAFGLITGAGFGTIVAVAGIFLFLFWVILPLFIPGSFHRIHYAALHEQERNVKALHLAVDDQNALAWSYLDNDSISVFLPPTGERIASYPLTNDVAITSRAFSQKDHNILLGLADGTLQQLSVDYVTVFRHDQDIAHENLPREASPATFIRYDDGVISRTPGGQWRYQKVRLRVTEPEAVADAAIHLVDFVQLHSGPVYASVCAEGVFRIQSVRETRNIMTGQTQRSLSGGSLALVDIGEHGLPDYLSLEGRADSALLIWRGGFTVRLDTRQRNEIVVAERLDLSSEQRKPITAIGHLLGKMTIVVGYDDGTLATWFRVRPNSQDLSQLSESDLPSDASSLVRAHQLEASSLNRHRAVSAIAMSHRTRKLAVGYDGGGMELFYVTSQRHLASIPGFSKDNSRVEALTISPRDDAIIAVSETDLATYSINYPHPQTSFAALFRPVWYESARDPAHVWQSTSGTDEFEPKYGMMPLIFGTLKATFYTMMFGAPLALLAAIYTSEFMAVRLRNRIKPIIEMMASLPSVVLGFLAAIIFAPVVEKMVPGVLASFVSLPFVFLLAAFFWQLLAKHWQRRIEPYTFFILMGLVPVGVALAFPIGASFESIFFAGDIKSWLSYTGAVTGDQASYASSVGGWFLTTLLAAVLLVAVVVLFVVNPWLNERLRGCSQAKIAGSNLIKFCVGVVFSGVLAWLAALSLSGIGFDARGSYIGTYSQRNALIVGFVMGFAVIPIIYTLAEDALSGVPEFLRAASLGAGATQWQTALYIVIPTAMSGLFSAVMVGFGRAVGETMIVLMAAGNTPVMDWNIFNGFRTLSANIAVELPEAVQHGTNYRLLFLAALCLFLITFLINTAAEVIRQRYRKRAFQL